MSRGAMNNVYTLTLCATINSTKHQLRSVASKQNMHGII